MKHMIGLFSAAVLSSVLFFSPNQAEAGCNMTITVRNTSTRSFTIHWDKSKSKVKGGLWKKLATRSSESVPPNGIKSLTVRSLFKCPTNRRFQIYTQRGGSTKTTYFPGASSWTKKYNFTVRIRM